jgi:hypothetical protein
MLVNKEEETKCPLRVEFNERLGSCLKSAKPTGALDPFQIRSLLELLTRRTPYRMR